VIIGESGICHWVHSLGPKDRNLRPEAEIVLGPFGEGAASPLPTSWGLGNAVISPIMFGAKSDRECILDALRTRKTGLVAANIAYLNPMQFSCSWKTWLP